MHNSLALKDGKLLKDVDISEIPRILENKENMLWLDIYKPTPEEFDILRSVFKFHPLSIEDCENVIETPRVDDFGEYLFIVFHAIDLDPKEGEEIEKREIDIFMGPNHVVSVHHEPMVAVKTTFDSYVRNPSKMTRGSDFVVHDILDTIVDRYLPMVTNLEEEIEKVEDKILEEETENIIEGMALLRRQVLDIKRSIAPQRIVVNRLVRRSNPLISEKAAVYFRDIYDHIVRIYETLDAERDLINSTFDTYLSMSSNKMGEIMKVLTIVATIFLPLTFIVGWYGMNFHDMPELSWHYGYYTVIIVALTLSLGMFAYMWKKKWF